ncbi:hypothetical protein D3C81_1239820 [compost metagenome]
MRPSQPGRRCGSRWPASASIAPEISRPAICASGKRARSAASPWPWPQPMSSARCGASRITSMRSCMRRPISPSRKSSWPKWRLRRSKASRLRRAGGRKASLPAELSGGSAACRDTDRQGSKKTRDRRARRTNAAAVPDGPRPDGKYTRAPRWAPGRLSASSGGPLCPRCCQAPVRCAAACSGMWCARPAPPTCCGRYGAAPFARWRWAAMPAARPAPPCRRRSTMPARWATTPARRTAWCCRSSSATRCRWPTGWRAASLQRCRRPGRRSGWRRPTCSRPSRWRRNGWPRAASTRPGKSPARWRAGSGCAPTPCCCGAGAIPAASARWTWPRGR